MKFERVLMHLRKSRADMEAEQRGEGETLSKHKKTLLKYAQEHSINIIKIRMELESGESLIHRPDMLLTLEEVEKRTYDGVLCMDIDRLGRGKMQDQGIILETFKKSKTRIITPRKVYDLDNEFDEEYTEFETFMARRELKFITRRLQRGRVTSVEEGNYIGTIPPYGYIIKELNDGRTLEPHPEQSQVVKMIFDWYTHDDPNKRIGSSRISNELNRLGYKTYTGKEWRPYAVINILKNAVYAGRIQWKRKEIKKSVEPGKKRDTRTRPRHEWIDVQGKHEAIISMNVYQKAQEILKGKYHVPYQLENGVSNPLAGLVRCGHCGSSMVRRPYTKQKPHYMCYNQLCQSKSTRFEYVEERLIDGLREWIDQFKDEWKDRKPKEDNADEIKLCETALRSLERELESLYNQKGKLHDFLERGIYDEDTYLERSNFLAERIDETKESIETAKNDLAMEVKRKRAQKDIIPQVEHALNFYYRTDDAKAKNQLLKSILDHAIYEKHKTQKGDDFTLVLYPKLANTDKV